MTELKSYKEKKLEKLYQRLNEIHNEIGIENNADYVGRNDTFASEMKMKKVSIMKEHFDEMIQIKSEIARLENNNKKKALNHITPNL